MAVLADYRTDLDNLLATAVDPSTWTTVLKDQGLRLGLGELNEQIIYEADFSVVSTGYEQNFATIAALYQVVALAYPWQEGSDFTRCTARWRRSGHHLVYFEYHEPRVGDIIRVRYTKLHTISGLDAAVATTSDNWRSLVGLWAAAWCCDLRVRQVSENPALPRDTMQHLRAVAVVFRQRAVNMLAADGVGAALRWGEVGL